MTQKIIAIFVILLALEFSAYSQGAATVYDPTRERPDAMISPSVRAEVDKAAIAAGKSISEETCKREVEVAGTATGAFTRAGAKQTLAFYQYCQTGNGFGWVGLVLLEDNEVVGNYISEAGWSNDIAGISDINRNGLDEFALVYSGGMHQGQGGTGVDLMEFKSGNPVGLGWYKAEEFGQTEAVNAWKLTAKAGSVPVFYTQKFFSGENQKYKSVGKAAPAKLGKAISKFKAVK